MASTRRRKRSSKPRAVKRTPPELEKLRIPSDLSKDWVAETVSIAEKLPESRLVDPAHPKDDMAAMLGEDVVIAATTGPDPSETIQDEITPAEAGGPYIETDASTEFGFDPDEAEPAAVPEVTPQQDIIPE